MIVLLSITLALGQTLRADATTTQITDNAVNDGWPQISGNNVVWVANDGSDNEIFLYDGTTTTQLTTNAMDDNGAQVSGNNVVWAGYDGSDYEIFLYDGTTTTQLTTNATEDNIPQVSGNNVVWRGYDGSDNEIFLYNGTTTTQLTDNARQDIEPRVSGNNVVWNSYVGSEGRDIFFYNGTTTTQLTDNAISNGISNDAYRISGNNVVWFGRDGLDFDIFRYDGTTTTQLTTNATEDMEPRVSGNNVVWEGYDGSDWEIYLYDGTTTTQLTDNATDDYKPAVSGNNVVWCRGSEIFLYDGATTTQLTSNAIDDTEPQVSGDNVTWAGQDGGDWDIFLHTSAAPEINNTLAGSTVDTVTVELGSGINVSFSDVTTDGITSFAQSASPVAGPPDGFRFRGNQLDITTTAGYAAPVSVTIPYDESQMPGNEQNLRLFHWNGSNWQDVTVSVDTVNNTITGRSNSLSPFIVMGPSTPSTGLNAFVLLLLALTALGAGYLLRSANNRFAKMS